VKAGQAAIFTVDAYPNRNFSAHVTEVRFSPRTIEGVVTYETVLTVDNRDLALLPGMTATADIVVKHIENALIIPNAALRFMPPGKHEEAKKKNRGLLGALLPHRPRKLSADKSDKHLLKGKQRLVWILRDGKPVSLAVTTGSTDGRMTEVLAGDITPGLELLIDVVRAKNE